MKLASAAILSIGLFAAQAIAQIDTQVSPAGASGPGGPGMHHGGPGFGHGMPAHVASITNAPFSAKYTVEAEHTAPGPDGVVHKFTTTDSVYRDSLGRTREDITTPAPRSHKPSSDGSTSTPASPGTTQTMTVIADPVSNTVTRLMPDRKIAMVETVPADFFKHAAAREAAQAAGTTRHRDNAATTDLGSKTFAGVVASGRRTTVTFPARNGEAESTPATMTHETWFSPDLKLEVSSSEIGSRGTNSDVLTSLTKAEPDATLFKIPDGYTVKTAPAHDGMRRGGQDRAPDGPPPAL